MLPTSLDSCAVPNCTSPLKRREYCYAHYMKWWRYGDPTWTRPKTRQDRTGERFGSLVVIAEAGVNHWTCQCDCGAKTRVRTWSLTSGGTRSCGNHNREAHVGYSAAHARVGRDRGPASAHACVDCAGAAQHWSYNHQDPDEVFDEETGSPYSLRSDFYEPRCVPCHKRFDLDREDKA